MSICKVPLGVSARITPLFTRVLEASTPAITPCGFSVLTLPPFSVAATSIVAAPWTVRSPTTLSVPALW